MLAEISEICRTELNTFIVSRDETCLIFGYTAEKAWRGTTACNDVSSTKRSGLSSGIQKKKPSGKGKPLKISHAGSHDGFIPNCLLHFVGNTENNDYHSEMNDTCLGPWI